jgi:protein TonB
MDFTAWTTEGRDTARRKRLAVGYGLGLLLIGSSVTAVALSAGAVAKEREDDPLTVALVSEPEPEPEPEPVAEPEPEKKPEPKKALQQLQAPTEIPTDRPAEAEPVASSGPEEDPYAKAQVTEQVEAKPAIVEAPKPPPPKPKPVVPRGPIRVTESVTPPTPVSQSAPGYPAEAKAAGIEGTVIIKYVVSERGDVTSAELVRGPAELAPACLTAVKGWRFQPALLEGRPVAVYRMARFPFRIRT